MLNKFYKLKSIDGAKKLTQTVKNSKYTTKDNEEIGRIHVSLLTSNGKEIDENSYIYELAEISGGFVYSGASQIKPTPMVMRLALTEDTTKTEQKKETNSNLIKILGQGNEGKYTVITSTGLIDSVKLKTVLNDSNKTDTDLDGLYDWDEVNTELIVKHLELENKQELKTINNSDLPLFSDLILHSSEWGSFKPYLWTESDFARYAYANCFDIVRILPIVSSPVDGDSDGDGMMDCIENNLDKTDYWDIKDENPLYAFADTSNNYGINAAGIYIKKTIKKPEEFIVKKTVKLPFFLYQILNYDDIGDPTPKLTGVSKSYVPFTYELQEYMQSCCDTVIAAAKENNVDKLRIELMEKYLTPELIMAIGVTESGWTYGYDNGKTTVGIDNSYTGLVGIGYINGCIGGFGASGTLSDYANIYCSIAGTACCLAQDFAYIGNGYGLGNKDYKLCTEQQFIYDVLYGYGDGRTLKNYERSETRISSAYKMYAFQEFLKINKKEWKEWRKENIEDYCNNKTVFTWEYHEPTDISNIKMPKSPMLTYPEMYKYRRVL